MPPLSLAAFTRCFNRLSADDRLEFVAALWSARGWQTRRDGDCIVARGDDVERRIRVFTPGFFGSPEFDGVDVLVVTDEDESVREAAADHAVRYVGPTDLRDRLLYSLPREEAERLADRHLGRSLTTDAARRGSASGGGSSRLRAYGKRLRQRLPDSRRALVLLVLLCVVGIVTAGPALLPAGNATPTTPESAGNFTPGTVGAIGSTATPEGGAGDGSAMPPGLSKGEVSDLPRLAAATAAVMAEEGWALRVYRQGPDRTVWRRGGEGWVQTVRAANDTVFRSVVRMEAENETITTDAYGDGETVYYRTERGDGEARYDTRPADDGEEMARVRSKVRTAIVAYLSSSDTSVSCAGTLENSDECFAYRIVVDGTPDLLSGDVGNYSARATVSDTGLVTSLDVRYTVPDPENRSEREQVRFGFTFDAHGNVTAPQPAWLAEAMEGTGTGASPTPTSSPEAGNATASAPTTTEAA